MNQSENNKDQVVTINLSQYSQVYKVINPALEGDQGYRSLPEYLAYKTLEFQSEYYSPRVTTGR